MSPLFRSSRPDFIETMGSPGFVAQSHTDCSGLPGRTSLRHGLDGPFRDSLAELFRSSRPDFIETSDPSGRSLPDGGIVPVF